MNTSLIKNWPFNADNPIVQQRLAINAKKVSLDKNQQLLISKDAQSGIYGVISGLAIVIIDDVQQTRKMNFLRGEGEWFGASSVPFEGEIQYGVDLLIEAIEPCEFFYIPSAKVLDTLIDVPHINLFIYQHFAQKARETLIPATIIGTSSLLTRICYFLLSVHQYYKASKGICVPLTQQGIAELINVSRQKVNQSLQQLVSEEAISLHRGYINILQPELLYNRLIEVLPFQLPKNILN